MVCLRTDPGVRELAVGILRKDPRHEEARCGAEGAKEEQQEGCRVEVAAEGQSGSVAVCIDHDREALAVS